MQFGEFLFSYMQLGFFQRACFLQVLYHLIHAGPENSVHCFQLRVRWERTIEASRPSDLDTIRIRVSWLSRDYNRKKQHRNSNHRIHCLLMLTPHL